MLLKRILVIFLLGPIVIAAIFFGGWPFSILVAAALGIAAWEFWRIFCNGCNSPSMLVLIAGVALQILARQQWNITGSAAVLSAGIMAAMAWHVFAYGRGQQQAGSDFAITTAGLAYLGWLGGYFISLRNLPDGQWWLMGMLGAVWIADSGAYLVGSRFGRHKMAPHVSPHKSWEGYLGGIGFAILGGALLGWLGQSVLPQVSIMEAAALAGAIAVITPMGDLGESMLKRQFGVKDSSNILPGHGGLLDRVDSWLWTVTLGYYLALWLG